MAKERYSVSLCRELRERSEQARLAYSPKPARREEGDVLDVVVTGVWPETEGRAVLRLDRFVGGGFAGQVYRSTLEKLEIDGPGEIPGLAAGGEYAVKILVPPSRGSRKFRNALFWLGFQGPFSAQVDRSAARAGALWQKLVRRAAAHVFGRDDAVADIFATFYDEELGAYGEIREWVHGRVWRLESDSRLRARRAWRTVVAESTGSPEYVAKRQFMARFVELLHEMGGIEFARQYEWSTLKSQPNVLKRSESGRGAGDGLCAVDFRAGLALLPFLPMSPGDVALILRGLARGSLVQFDRMDVARLRAFAAKDDAPLGDLATAVERFAEYDAQYRGSLPDVWHQGLRLLVQPDLRRSVRRGLVEGYAADGLVDAEHAERLQACVGRFTAFYLAGAIPVLGKFLRRWWGSGAYRCHLARIWGERGYLVRTWRAALARRVLGWHRAGRAGEERSRFLAEHADSFWVQRLTIGFLPAKLHRCLAEPRYVMARLRDGWRFARDFYRDAAFRERWLTDQVREGYEDGMLHDDERDRILACVREPYIVKYLKCLAVHFCTLPITQIVSVATGSVVVAWALAAGKSWQVAAGLFGGVLLLFQVTPISPGSLCRGLYVVYVMVREKNFRDYMVAAPISFVKYVGYLSFPIQMATTYPELSQFMAGRWATQAVHIVPVFGEKGALLEHWVFDMAFNVTRAFGRWASRHVKGLLDTWLLFGIAVLAAVFRLSGIDWTSKGGINLTLAVFVLCILPRLFFYPVLKRRSARRERR